MSLVDSTGAAVTTLQPNATATGVAVLTSNGTPLSGQIVTFAAGTSTFINLNPSSGAVLTDSTGTARIAVTSNGTGSGAVALTATANYNAQTVSGSTNFAVGQSVGTGLVLSSIVSGVGTGTLSSYGTTSIVATVTQTTGGVPSQPVTVNFSTSCPVSTGTPPSAGATITSSATTLPDGTAHATFADNGCAPSTQTTVIVTASISTGSKSVSFLLNPPTSGSMKYVSATNTSLALKGQGGSNSSSNTTLTFRLVDTGNLGVPSYPVCFDATTYLGGLTIDGFNNLAMPSGAQRGTTAQCGSDNTLFYLKNTDSSGLVTVQVSSGTAPTPVRVRARSLYPANATVLLETLSDQLTVSTGLPVDHNMDISVDHANIDGGDFSGSIAKLTVRLADYFGNPVPDNTQVNFVTSGGAALCPAGVNGGNGGGSCLTTAGTCGCTLVSQDFRPADGRVVVMAYTIGLPDFIDVAGTYQFDPTKDTFTVLGDAFLDANKDGIYGNPANVAADALNGSDKCFPYVNGAKCVWDPATNTQPGVFAAPIPDPIPGDPNVTASNPVDTGIWTAADGNPVFGPVFLRRSVIIYFSYSSSAHPTVIIPTGEFAMDTTASSAFNGTNVVPISTKTCATTVVGYLTDGNGNPMAAGTTVTAVPPPGVSDPKLGTAFPTGIGNYGGRAPSTIYDYPAVGRSTISNASSNVQIIGDKVTATVSSTGCTGDYSFQFQVKSPTGALANAFVVFEGENPSTVGRDYVPIHFQ